MSERLVEYFVVAGVGKADPRLATSNDLNVSTVEVEACVLQRLPVENRSDASLPNGLERFCRPLGWNLTSHPPRPAYMNFILTSETGKRLYCSSLNFYQPSSKMAYKQRQKQKEQEKLLKEQMRKEGHGMPEDDDQADQHSIRRGTGSSRSFYERRRTAFKRKEEVSSPNISPSPSPIPPPTSSSPLPHNTSSISISSIDINLDEENEVRMTNTLDIEDLYEPVSLCVVSKFPLFDGLQALLKSIYIYWSEIDTLKKLSSTKRRHQTLEPLLAELLSDLRFSIGNKPPVKRSFGPLKEIVLPTLVSVQSLTYTSTDVYSLLKSLGVHGLVQLLSILLSDGKVLFLSSSSTAITSAMMGLMSIMYPVGTSHFSCVLIPSGLLECLQCITPFIMGLNRSLLEELDDEPLDVAIVDIDNGQIQSPEMLIYSCFPSELLHPVMTALGRIIDPGYEHRDEVFSTIRPDLTPYQQDKAIRAVFINVFLYLLGSYQHYLTVLRFHPEPSFYFDKEEFIARFTEGEDSEVWKTFLESFSETIGFINFTKGDRAIPYRLCDLFDELVNEYYSMPDVLSIDRLLSSTVVSSVTDRLIELIPLSVTNGGDFSQRRSSSLHQLGEGASQTRFPEIKEEEFNSITEDLEARWKGAANISPDSLLSNVPLLPTLGSCPFHTPSGSILRSTTVLHRDADTLHKFLDALFNSRVLEARKYFPSVTLSLRANTTIHMFVPELVNRLLKRGAFLTSEQFEILVRVLNIILTNKKVAVHVLPLTTVFYQEVQPGVSQYVYTCLQSHQLWSSLGFWSNALFHAVQSELVRVYAEIPRRNSSPLKQQGSDDMIGEEEEDDEVEMDEQQQEELEKDNEMSIGEVTLRQRRRVLSFSPRDAQNTARRVALSKSARMRIRASMMIPGASEGVLPPDAKPVTTLEALHHLAKRLRAWSKMGEEEKKEMIRQEENAIKNQIILFISRMINMKTPLEFADHNEKSQFINQLTLFIERLISIVDEDLSIGYKKQRDIMEQVEAMIEVHLNSLDYLRRLLKKSPTAKARVVNPPLIPGEQMIQDAVHCYLLPDGRDIGSFVPADGHVFVTTYRIIFLGSPWDPEVDPNILVTRSMPISSIYRIKELSQIPASLTLDCVVTRGIQIRSVTSELIRLGFDDDSSITKMKNLHTKLNEVRYPRDLTLGVKNQKPFQVIQRPTCEMAETKEKNQGPKRRRTPDDSQGIDVMGGKFKLVSDLSRSSYCMDYDRLGLGSVNIPSKNKGNPWRLTIINVPYTVCSSYPSVWVVADKLSDESLARIASQFQSSRLPVVTWRHRDNEAVLLRAASFVVPTLVHRKKPSIQLSKNTSSGKIVETGGILSSDVEALITTIVNTCPGVGEEFGLSGSFTQEMSVPPASLMFAPLDESHSQINPQSSVTSLDGGEGGEGGGLTRKGSEQSIESFGSDSPVATRYQYSLYAATEVGYDWESTTNPPPSSHEYTRNPSLEEQPMTLASAHVQQGDWEGQPPSLAPSTSLAPASTNEEQNVPSYSSPKFQRRFSITKRRTALDVGEVFGRGISKKSKQDNSQVNFASLPTAPRDWVVMDALQKELVNWQPNGLYIIGEKRILGNVPSDLYAGTTLLPVEFPHFTDITNSFYKFMRACSPTGSTSTKYLSQLEESEWMNQLSSLIQLAAAISDLMDSQGSSVMVCLEEGMDATAQVISLAELLLDPYYRTIEGFITLIEKEWLAFGHPFSSRGRHLDGTDPFQFSPVFLQFLDCVHQIHRQFPLSFEFNDFFLRTIAYHHSSMRFHTFTLDSEKERCARNWLHYRPRPVSTYGDANNTEPHASLWKYVDFLRTRSTMFQNFLYTEEESTDLLRPHGYQANLEVWPFFLDNSLSFFPPYDVELISDGPLTFTDLHYDVFQWDSTFADVGIPIDPPPDLANELTQLLKEYTGLKNEMAHTNESPLSTWEHLWRSIVKEARDRGKNIQPPNRDTDSLNPEATLRSVAKRHNNTLHKTIALAVLIKGKLSVEMEKHYNNPHNFAPFRLHQLQFECSYCHHFMKGKEGFKCKNCGCVCHHYCRQSMPMNCGHSNGTIPPTTTGGSSEQQRTGKDERTNVARTWSVSKGVGTDLHECEGFLYKRGGVVKNWKLRYFVLDLDKRHLAYYESDKKDAKLCGKIMTEDIVQIEECEPQQVPTTILSSGRMGYFFKLTTHHRIFHLMTFRSSTRSVWIQRISSTCINK